MKKVVLSLVILAMFAVAACKQSNTSNPLGSNPGPGGPGGPGGTGSPNTPTPTPVLTPFIILANGITSAWMGRTITAESEPTGSMSAGPADPISGQTSSTISVPSVPSTGMFANVAWLRLTTCPIGTPIQCPYPIYTTGFVARAHITFNLRLDLPVSEIDAAYIVWGNPNCGLHHYDLPFAQLSTTNFVHFDVPLSAFSYPNTGACSLPQTTAFQINIERIGPTVTNGGFSIADVEWQAP